LIILLFVFYVSFSSNYSIIINQYKRCTIRSGWVPASLFLFDSPHLECSDGLKHQVIFLIYSTTQFHPATHWWWNFTLSCWCTT